MAIKARSSELWSNVGIKVKEFPELLKNPKKRWWVILPTLIVLVGLGGGIYYNKVYLPAHSIATASLQTTVARRGDISLSASGTGTLTPATQVQLGFGTNGKITKLNVKVGDQVKAGQLLAELDNTSQQISYQQAKRNLAQLTSPGAIAQAQESIATATSAVSNAKNYLIYLISPDIFYWEQRIAEDQAALDQAKADGGASPTGDQQKKINDAAAKLASDQESMAGRMLWYTQSYVPNNFTVVTRDPTTRQSTKSVQAPTDADIAGARAAYTVAQSTLQEAQWYLDALNGKDVPDNATGASLSTFEQAKLDLQSAQASLDATQLYAPFDGTIMSLSARLGDTVSSSAIMTVADLSKLYLQTYIDESDYEKFKVGNEADIVFDALPDQTFFGKVIQIDPALNTSSGASVVSGLVEMEPTQADLLIGMGASVTVVAGKATNAILVSVNALHEYAPGQFAVFVMRNGKLAVQNVEIGLKDLVNAEVISGLQPGDVVSTGITETRQ